MKNLEVLKLKEKFVETLKPEKIYLFGSYAKGTEREDSDYDFYIVLPDSISDLVSASADAYKCIRFCCNKPVDIVVGRKKRFESRQNGPTLENEVLKTGVLLYG